jgi:uridylate kinase
MLPTPLRPCLPCAAAAATPQVMDETAVTLCKENDIKIVIFDAMVPGNITRAAMGEDVGTLVSHTNGC